MKQSVASFFVSLTAWLVFSWAADAGHIVAGIAVSALVAVLAGGIDPGAVTKKRSALRYAWLFVYLPVLAADLLRSALDVILRLLAPTPRENAGFVTLPVRLKSDAGRALFATTLTLLPGVLSADVSDDGSVFDLYCFDAPQAGEMVRRYADKYELLLGRMFD